MRSRSGRRPTATLDRRLSGLAERVYDIAYSPDGKWMATASGDPGIFGVAKLWSAEPGGGGKPVRDLVETQDVVFSVAFSPDSKKIATAGADRTIRVFEVETGKLLVQIEDHADWIFAVAFSPDGKRLASASRDKTCKVFDVEKKESLVTFPGHAQPVYTVSFTPDGKGVATGGEDNRIRIWNPDNDGKQIREIGGFGGTVFKLRYSPDGKTLARLQRRQDGPRLRGQRVLAAQAARTPGLDLLPGDLPGRQDRRLGELGRRGPALEPRRRQAAPQLHRRAGLQAGGDHEGRGPMIGSRTRPEPRVEVDEDGRPFTRNTRNTRPWNRRDTHQVIFSLLSSVVFRVAIAIVSRGCESLLSRPCRRREGAAFADRSRTLPADDRREPAWPGIGQACPVDRSPAVSGRPSASVPEWASSPDRSAAEPRRIDARPTHGLIAPPLDPRTSLAKPEPRRRSAKGPGSPELGGATRESDPPTKSPRIRNVRVGRQARPTARMTIAGLAEPSRTGSIEVNLARLRGSQRRERSRSSR